MVCLAVGLPCLPACLPTSAPLHPCATPLLTLSRAAAQAAAQRARHGGCQGCGGVAPAAPGGRRRRRAQPARAAVGRRLRVCSGWRGADGAPGAAPRLRSGVRRHVCTLSWPRWQAGCLAAMRPTATAAAIWLPRPQVARAAGHAPAELYLLAVQSTTKAFPGRPTRAELLGGEGELADAYRLACAAQRARGTEGQVRAACMLACLGWLGWAWLGRRLPGSLRRLLCWLARACCRVRSKLRARKPSLWPAGCCGGGAAGSGARPGAAAGPGGAASLGAGRPGSAV